MQFPLFANVRTFFAVTLHIAASHWNAIAKCAALYIFMSAKVQRFLKGYMGAWRV
jgi:hypothetical protein